MTLEYWNELAKQTNLISSLLTGFSVAIVANLIVSDKKDKLTKLLLKTSSLSAACFLVSTFAMIHIIMTTTPGGIIQNIQLEDFNLQRIIGLTTFILGIFALTTMISLSGWTKNRSTGFFTTVVGLFTLFLIFVTMTRISL